MLRTDGLRHAIWLFKRLTALEAAKLTDYRTRRIRIFSLEEHPPKEFSDSEIRQSEERLAAYERMTALCSAALDEWFAWARPEPLRQVLSECYRRRADHEMELYYSGRVQLRDYSGEKPIDATDREVSELEFRIEQYDRFLNDYCMYE